jgi:23S rRNA (adenine2503-C2)-methyltransferase
MVDVEPGENVFGWRREELASRFAELGLKPLRARQVYRWLYARAGTDFLSMTDLPRGEREELARRFRVAHPKTLERYGSRDGTSRYLLELEDGSRVEAVAIPEPARRTVCLSTQVGCPLKCSFCFSGTVRFKRNLTVGEILGQFLTVESSRRSGPTRTNVVFMGMGEPLLNSAAVLAALEVLTDPQGFSVSPRRITVSTAGLASELERFAAAAPPVGLAVSLHATTNEIRGRLMPVNARYPLEALLDATRRLPLRRRRRVTFEYVLLGGENDSPADAWRLAGLLRGLRAKVNLIAFNPWPGAPHGASTPEATERFMEILSGRGYTVSLRRSRGDDILAACGQLAGCGEALRGVGRAP